MKKIEAIIREAKLEQVTMELQNHGIHGMTITRVMGLGAQAGRTLSYRGSERRVELVTRAKLEIVVDNALAEQVIDTIYQNAHTGEIGDGRILVIDLESVVRIRTGEVCDSHDEDGYLAAGPHATTPPRPLAPAW